MGLSKEKTRLLDRLKTPRFRAREGQFLVEGTRAAEEFLGGRIQWDIRFALMSPRLRAMASGGRVVSRLEASEVPLEEVSDRELADASATEHPQGVMLVVREVEQALPLQGQSGFERILLLDGVQDPGNAGTLVRAGRAFGVTRAVALEGTVDLFNPKVVRASAGALAHLPVHRLSWSRIAGWLEEGGIPLIVGSRGGRDIRSVSPPPAWALAVGNEGAGVRDELREAATQVVGIPMAPEVESLNAGVAGAILMFGMFGLKPVRGPRTEN